MIDFKFVRSLPDPQVFISEFSTRRSWMDVCWLWVYFGAFEAFRKTVINRLDWNKLKIVNWINWLTRAPYWLIDAMLRAFNFGNAQYFLQNNSKDEIEPPAASNTKPKGEFFLKKRFQFNWNLVKGNVTDETKIYFLV